MSLFDLALTKGVGNTFDALTLARVAAQTKQYSKPVTSIGLTLIPLAIIAFLVLRK
tara:strand:+ start:439 stop:606 length:168 start_codon:yes stop_codon:yes gene_type:complete